MVLQVYNTLTRQITPFETLTSNEVKMYVCGPTVYANAHVGHAMSAIVFDCIRRYLEYSGYRVLHVMNYTDVDDKIILRARERGEDPSTLAEGYINDFQEHLKSLNILPATIYPRATREIDGMVGVIQSLIQSGYAYAADGDVYFRVTKDADYGRLSGRKLEEMQAGARVEVGDQKEHPMDFALWKAAKPGEPSWPSPWGPGRPGWHIECSVMNLHYLGEQIDIHGGGNDLIFPHHENEIAQTESYTGRIPFARYWLHNGMMQLGGEKMSKSLGNLVTIRDYLTQHPADSLRMLVLSSHYRAPLNFSDENIANAERSLERLQSALRPPTGNLESGGVADALRKTTEQARTGFVAAMDNDFNTASALAQVYDLMRAINTARDAAVGGPSFQEAQATLREVTGVLGLTLAVKEAKVEEAAPFIDLLLSTRAGLREAKQYALADGIRQSLAGLGIILEDGPEGTTWRPA